MNATTTSSRWTVPGSKRARRGPAAFASARRHTALVRFLRTAIPLGAVVSVLMLIVTPFLAPLSGLPGVSIGAVGIVNGKVRMETPRLSGFRKDNRPYEVNAQSALQDIRNPTQVELTALTARLSMEREGWVTVGARTGFFDTQSEKLRLVDDVTVRTESGYDIAMQTANIDFKAGTVVSTKPVKVNLGAATVDADTLDVKNNGELIVFQGRVRAVIENAPAKSLAGPERAGSTPAPELLRPSASAVVEADPPTEARR